MVAVCAHLIIYRSEGVAADVGMVLQSDCINFGLFLRYKKNSFVLCLITLVVVAAIAITMKPLPTLF